MMDEENKSQQDSQTATEELNSFLEKYPGWTGYVQAFRNKGETDEDILDALY